MDGTQNREEEVKEHLGDRTGRVKTRRSETDLHRSSVGDKRDIAAHGGTHGTDHTIKTRLLSSFCRTDRLDLVVHPKGSRLRCSKWGRSHRSEREAAEEAQLRGLGPSFDLAFGKSLSCVADTFFF
jgi:hypothetical protein